MLKLIIQKKKTLQKNNEVSESGQWEDRTPDHLGVNQALVPAELTARLIDILFIHFIWKSVNNLLLKNKKNVNNLIFFDDLNYNKC